MTGDTLTATVHRAWAADLEPAQLYALLRLRVEVFVVEQACAYAELDGRDLEPRARHYWLSAHGEGAPLLGCLRLLKEPDGDYRIGRLCTQHSVRGRGLGVQLMTAALGEIGDKPVTLDAQLHAAEFYRGFGFAAVGPAYDLDGVAHLPMRRDGR